MKQLIQDLSKGVITQIEAPAPQLTDNSLLIATSTSLISIGTERMLLDFGRASYINKARQQPEKVKMVLEKIKTDGLLSTFDAVKSKLEKPLSLGYCQVGTVLEVGKNVQEFKVGERVISNGPHADLVNIGKNLCARVPAGVEDEAAVFTVLASIALQGVRLAQPTLGERFVVFGVGLIGLLTVQLLRIHGCRVLALDFDESKLNLAQQFGAETCHLKQNDDPVSRGMTFSHGEGVDGVIITASTQSNDPVMQGARMCRKRGRIILVGVTGLQLNRADFYEKELTFQVSCSYGPGRYDPAYENKGLDYPIGFVRWTEQRNFEAILDIMASGLLNVKPLISHRFLFEEADKAYDVMSEDKQALGILLTYSSDIKQRLIDEVSIPSSIHYKASTATVGFIGAGNYASRILIPAFKEAKAKFGTIVTANGLSGVINGQKAGFVRASTDIEKVFGDQNCNTIVIATRHDTHAQLVIKALKARKNVFVEKPLAIHLEELKEIESTYHELISENQPVRLMVGFNRRFAPQIQKMKGLLSDIQEPKNMIFTINAGSIPAAHWTQDLQVGGGRIVGEACHFIDLMRFLIGCKIKSIQTRYLGKNTIKDNATLYLDFIDGSCGTIHYLSNGASTYQKERIEVFAGGRILQLNNFRQLRGFGWKNFSKWNLWRQNKGQNECVKEFLSCIENSLPTPIPIEEIFEVAHYSIEAAKQKD